MLLLFKKRFFNSLLALFLILFLIFPFLAKADSEKFTDVQRTMLFNKPGVVFITHYDTVNLVIQTSAGSRN